MIFLLYIKRKYRTKKMIIFILKNRNPLFLLQCWQLAKAVEVDCIGSGGGEAH